MPFSEEPLDDHHECRREIHDLEAEIERLRAGITELDIRLLGGCKLGNQDDGQWWLSDSGGEGLYGGTGSLIDIVEQLASKAK